MTRRRRFEPSGLVAGLLFLAVAAGAACDAAGRWHPAPMLLVPVVVGGLVLTGLTRAATSARRRRAARPGAADPVSGDGAS